jgi:hypothetical protein
MTFIKNESALRALFGEKAFKNLKDLIDPCCGTASQLVSPIVTTSVSDIGSNFATFNGNISGIENDELGPRGFIFSVLPNQNIFNVDNNNTFNFSEGIGNGNFERNYYVYFGNESISANSDLIPLLIPETTYYVRAYTYTQNNAVYYGNEVSFKTLPVGQTGEAGGIVFFDKGYYSNGWRYLETSTEDQDNTDITWGCLGTDILTFLGIGQGLTNTDLIVNDCADPLIAAKVCKDLILGGKDDWFLASGNEGILLARNFQTLNLWSFDEYFTSSQNGSNQFYKTYLHPDGNYYLGTENKDQKPFNLRAVRRF